MPVMTAKRVVTVLIAVFSVGLLAGCAGMERRPENRTGYMYYPTALVKADQALADARKAGKDRECPEEFNALKDRVDKAYEVYIACRTQEAIGMAQEATGKIKALCPARPRAEMKPEPAPVAPPKPAPVPTPVAPPPPPPVPAPVAIPAPKVVEKVISLEDVHFDLDKSTLTEEAQTILKRNIQVLKQNPDVRFRIQGHTSAIATEEYNQSLSERRANTVNEFLVKEGGIAPDRLTKIGYGETRLEMPEPNPEIVESAAAKTNRRVIFKIIVK